MQLEITNLSGESIDCDLLKKATQKAGEVLGKEKIKEISLVVVGDEKMREINKKYRHQDKITDVLSFEELNEIYICLPQAKRQSSFSLETGLLKTALNFELTRLLAHGIVHLSGYDHEKSEIQAEKMKALEEKILGKIK